LGDVGDVEHAERDRDADADRGVEAAEQDAGDDRVDQQIERDHDLTAATGNGHLARRNAARLSATWQLPPRRCLRDRAGGPATLDQHRRALLSAMVRPGRLSADGRGAILAGDAARRLNSPEGTRI